VYPFLHTFPATDPGASVWIDRAVAECPFTTSVLRAIPGVRTALFSRMGPHTTLELHTVRPHGRGGGGGMQRL
jgi:aspartyl/asparaginyl beta-hydroxylase (cupin superfamily)